MIRWLAWAMLLTPLALPAAEPAVSSTPYQTLYQVLAPVRSIRGYDRLVALERVASKSADVSAQAIRIVVRARRGDIVVPVGADGAVDFPVDDALREENPAVETNQPKGSLSLTVNAGLRMPDALTMPWSDVAAALQQAAELFAKNAAGTPPPNVRGVEIRFAPGAPASVTVQGRSERLLKADVDGRILVTRDMIVEGERPTLVFSRRAVSMLPYVDS